jgi:hypothetical protein
MAVTKQLDLVMRVSNTRRNQRCLLFCTTTSSIKALDSALAIYKTVQSFAMLAIQTSESRELVFPCFVLSNPLFTTPISL